MNITLTIIAQIPEHKLGSFFAREAAGNVINGLKAIKKIGGQYDVNAIHAFTQDLRGAAGVIEFTVVIDNDDISAAEELDCMQEIIESLPQTHVLIINKSSNPDIKPL